MSRGYSHEPDTLQRIRDGKAAKVEPAMRALATFVEDHNPYILSYRFYLDPDVREMTVVAEHPDSAALVHHMDVGEEEFRKFGELVELRSISVYGKVDEPVMERLRAKAEYLGSATITVYDERAGFARAGEAAPPRR